MSTLANKLFAARDKVKRSSNELICLMTSKFYHDLMHEDYQKNMAYFYPVASGTPTEVLGSHLIFIYPNQGVDVMFIPKF